MDEEKQHPMTAAGAKKQGGGAGSKPGGKPQPEGERTAVQTAGQDMGQTSAANLAGANPGKVAQKGNRPIDRQVQELKTRLKAAEAAAEISDQKRSAAEAKVEAQSYPLAGPAKMRKRHWGLIASFVVLVLAPLAAVIFYLATVAEDQYQSTTGFTVRSQDSSSANDLLGGLASFAGSSTASDSDILYEFIQSQEMMEAVDAQIDLRAHYSQHWPSDWAFSIWPEATQEEMIWYWQRIVSISFDSSSGLIEVQALGFDPKTAQAITRAIVAESQTRINALNQQARADAIGYAQADLEEAVEEMKAAREALTRFRTRTRIVDPEADIQGRMGVMNNLQQELATSLIEYDLLRGTVATGDPRLKKAQQRIDVIRQRIDIERQTFTSTNTDTGGVGEDYPSLISEFERLTVDREYSEEAYRAALTGLALARDEASRQSRYLATYINPTRAQEAEYPERFVLSGLVALFLVLGWSILSLIYYSIRDRS